MKIFLITFILMIVVSSAEEKDNTFQINDEIVQIEDSNEIRYMNDVSEHPEDDKISDKIDDDDDILKNLYQKKKIQIILLMKKINLLKHFWNKKNMLNGEKI